ncbi:hypothetical protein BpHYR1_018425 [Brachionus plicatilis]|uniref:Uncharacterized protein n=1 Tax=Brachionus plicatilis TaxID=10195 RepID=A0A3M7PK47_BRAPC|nr:hypothetical protein BpHYR1_018425 [Brachionus plicatilis]
MLTKMKISLKICPIGQKIDCPESFYFWQTLNKFKANFFKTEFVTKYLSLYRRNLTIVLQNNLVLTVFYFKLQNGMHKVTSKVGCNKMLAYLKKCK